MSITTNPPSHTKSTPASAAAAAHNHRPTHPRPPRLRRDRRLIVLLLLILPSRVRAAGVLYTTIPSDLGGVLAMIDPASGVVTQVGSPFFGSAEGLAYDSRNDVLYVSTRPLFSPSPYGPYDLSRIDRRTGQFTRVGSIGYDVVAGLAYDSRSDRLFGVSADLLHPTLLTINRATGAGTPSPNPEVTGGASLEYLPRTDQLLVSGFDTRVSTFTLYDLQTHSEHPVPGEFQGGIFGTAYDPDTDTLYALPGGAYREPGNTLYTLDLAGGTGLTVTHALTLSRTDHYSAMAFVPLPEPAVPAIAFGAAVGFLRRRTRLRIEIPNGGQRRTRFRSQEAGAASRQAPL